MIAADPQTKRFSLEDLNAHAKSMMAKSSDPVVKYETPAYSAQVINPKTNAQITIEESSIDRLTDSIEKAVERGVEIGIKRGIEQANITNISKASIVGTNRFNNQGAGVFSGRAQPYFPPSTNSNQYEQEKGSEAAKGVASSAALLGLGQIQTLAFNRSSRSGPPRLQGLVGATYKASNILKLAALYKAAQTASDYLKTGTEYPLKNPIPLQYGLSLPTGSLYQDSRGYVITQDGSYLVDQNQQPVKAKTINLSNLAKYNPGLIKKLQNSLTSQQGLTSTVATTAKVGAAAYTAHAVYSGIRNRSEIAGNVGSWWSNSKKYWSKKYQAYKRLLRRPGAKGKVLKKAGVAGGAAAATLLGVMALLGKKSDKAIAEAQNQNPQNLPENTNDTPNVITLGGKDYSAEQTRHASIDSNDLAISNQQDEYQEFKRQHRVIGVGMPSPVDDKEDDSEVETENQSVAPTDSQDYNQISDAEVQPLPTVTSENQNTSPVPDLVTAGVRLTSGFITEELANREVAAKGANANKFVKSLPAINEAVFGLKDLYDIKKDKTKSDREKLEESGGVVGETGASMAMSLSGANRRLEKYFETKFSGTKAAGFKGFAATTLISMLISAISNKLGSKVGEKIADYKGLKPKEESDKNTEPDSVVSISSLGHSADDARHAAIDNTDLSVQAQSQPMPVVVDTPSVRQDMPNTPVVSDNDNTQQIQQPRKEKAEANAAVSLAEAAATMGLTHFADKEKGKGDAGNKLIKNLPSISSLGFGAADLYRIGTDKNRTQREKLEDSGEVIGQRGSDIAMDKLNIGSKINKKVFDKLKRRLPKGAKAVAFVAEMAAGLIGSMFMGKVGKKVGEKIADYKKLEKTVDQTSEDLEQSNQDLTEQNTKTVQSLTDVTKQLSKTADIIVSTTPSDTRHDYRSNEDLNIGQKASGTDKPLEDLTVKDLTLGKEAASTLGGTIADAIKESGIGKPSKKPVKHHYGQQIDYKDPVPKVPESGDVITNITVEGDEITNNTEEKKKKCWEDPNSPCNKKVIDDISDQVGGDIQGNPLSDKLTPSTEAEPRRVVIDNIKEIDCCCGNCPESGPTVAGVVQPSAVVAPVEKPEKELLDAPWLPDFPYRKPPSALMEDVKDLKPRPPRGTPPPDAPRIGKWAGAAGNVIEAGVAGYNIYDIATDEDMSKRDKATGIGKEAGGAIGSIGAGIAAGAATGAVVGGPIGLIAGVIVGGIAGWLGGEVGEKVGEAAGEVYADQMGETIEKSDAFYKEREQTKQQSGQTTTTSQVVTVPTSTPSGQSQNQQTVVVKPTEPNQAEVERKENEEAKKQKEAQDNNKPVAANSTASMTNLTPLAATENPVVVAQGAGGANMVYSAGNINPAQGDFVTPTTVVTGQWSGGSSGAARGSSSGGSVGSGAGVAAAGVAGAAVGAGASVAGGAVSGVAAPVATGVAGAGLVGAALVPDSVQAQPSPTANVVNPSTLSTNNNPPTQQPTVAGSGGGGISPDLKPIGNQPITNTPAQPNKVSRADIPEAGRMRVSKAAMEKRLQLAHGNFENASKTSGVEIGTLAKIANIESAFDPTINPVSRNPDKNKYTVKGGEGIGAGISSAHGYGQVLNDTWQDLVMKHGAKYGVIGTGAKGKITKEDAFKYRMDPKVQAGMLAEYSRIGNDLGQKYGGKDVDANIYAHHNLGPGEAAQLFKALRDRPNAPITAVLSAKTIENNPNLYKRGMSAKQAYDNLGHEMRAGEGYAKAMRNMSEQKKNNPAQSTVTTPTPTTSQQTPVVSPSSLNKPEPNENTGQVTSARTQSDTPPPNTTPNVVQPAAEGGEIRAQGSPKVTNVNRPPTEVVERSKWTSQDVVVQPPPEAAKPHGGPNSQNVSVRATIDEVPLASNNMGLVLLNSGYV